MDNNAQSIKDKIRDRHSAAARFRMNLMTTQIEKRKEVSRIMKETEEYMKEKAEKEAADKEQESSTKENKE